MAEATFSLPPQYDPSQVEARLYREWQDRGVFAPREGGAPYVIVIPPPNVTAVLHMGHGLNNTIQDVLIRFERMRGRATLCLPGTDHAGIATQNVVEKQLAAEGKTRFDLGREAFEARVWQFVRETGPVILEQLKVIGCSCDWSRTRFTLDPGLSRAVREVFVRLWEENLIYRGHRVIHWCPRCLTALSDEEAEHHETNGNLYYINYPLVDGSGHVTVATTRPETMLGDTAVVVHPDDPRGAPFIGKQVRLPIANIAIPVLADESVDREFGTGFVKVTPAHDPNDFEIGKRHKLEMPLVMTEDGKMGEEPGSGMREAGRVPAALKGMDRFAARKQIVKMLEAEGLLVKVEPHRHAVRRCYRCDTVVEPRLSDQWFVKMQPLAEPALAAFEQGELRFVPDRWDATYRNWLANIRDWNISRQLWWGHRIPVFTCTKCAHQWAAREDPPACVKCGGAVVQDPDVLDTWFSSWLWPFSTMGWPERTADLARYYPGHTLVTAPEILFFWVARMVMSGLKFMGKLPFTTVYLTGTVRDTQHRKMSKSLGNGIDPLDVVARFGADALRWTSVANTALGQDLLLDPADLDTTFAPGRNFANKLWNIGRFILSQLAPDVPRLDQIDRKNLGLADRWILSRLQAAIRDATTAYEQFRLDDGAKRGYAFAWDELADWYLEVTKISAAAEAGAPDAAGARWAAAEGGPAAAAATQAVLAHCFDQVLHLLHPVVPFITEDLWQKLSGRGPGELLAIDSWPVIDENLIDRAAEQEFDEFKQATSAGRTIKAEKKLSRAKTHLWVLGPNDAINKRLESRRDLIQIMSGSSSVHVGPLPDATMPHATIVTASAISVSIPLEGIDVSEECRRLSGELARLDQQLSGLAAKLGNENFIARAPADVVARERDKERAWREQRGVLAGKLEALGCS